jgi:hypothetical protein
MRDTACLQAEAFLDKDRLTVAQAQLHGKASQTVSSQ